MIKYKHPQGATITVYPDGSVVKYDKNGKATKTSATAEKLAKGHGGWVKVDGEEPDFSVLATAREAIPNGGTVRIPMKFKNGLISDLPRYIADDNYLIQQKIDGVRAQIVFEKGVKGCWVRSNSGTRLKSTTAAPTMLKVESEFSEYESPMDFCIDGEIISGVFWAFDFIDSGAGDLMNRIAALEYWAPQHSVVKVLSTAKTTEEKADLVRKVTDSNGEGFIVKQKDSAYIWGGRVEHSLKIKLVDTADCIVTAVSATKDSICLGLNDSVGMVEVGKTSTIGKGTFVVGDVVEVQYLYAGAGGKLVQPTILRKRTDKPAMDCTLGQLKFVNKEVVV